MTTSTLIPHDWSCHDLLAPTYGIGFHTFIKVHIQSRPPCTIMSEYYSYGDFPSFDDFDCGDMIQGPGETEGHVLRERGRPGGCGAEWRDMGHLHLLHTLTVAVASFILMFQVNNKLY